MADGTKIEWADATVNAINGCSLASPGCTNCYAMRLAGTRLRNHPSREGLTTPSKAGPVWNGTVRLSETALLQPLRWRAPRVIFWNAHGDPFHPAVPFAWVDRMFAVSALTPQHKHLVLTKRPGRMREYLTAPLVSERIGEMAFDIASTQFSRDYAEQVNLAGELDHWPLRNVWLGTSAEDQARLNERAVDLLNMPEGFELFLSLEPLLGPVDPTRICLVPQVSGSLRAGIHIDALRGRYVESGRDYIGEWDVNGPYPEGMPRRKIAGVIVGGESGPGARPMHPIWARSLRDQCAEAGTDFHFKQWGEWGRDPVHDGGPGAFGKESEVECAAWTGDRWHRAADWIAMPVEFAVGHGEWVYRLGKKRSGRVLDGVTHDALLWRREAAA